VMTVYETVNRAEKLAFQPPKMVSYRGQLEDKCFIFYKTDT